LDRKLGRLEGQANHGSNLDFIFQTDGKSPRARPYLTEAPQLYAQLGLHTDHPNVKMVRDALERVDDSTDRRFPNRYLPIFESPVRFVESVVRSIPVGRI